MKFNKTQKSKIALAIYQLEDLQSSIDVESVHAEADDILCQLLIILGCGEVVEKYNKVPKWYA